MRRKGPPRRTVSLAERVKLRDARPGPRPGDFIIWPGEAEPRRIAIVYREMSGTAGTSEPPRYNGVTPATPGSCFNLDWRGEMDMSGGNDFTRDVPQAELIDTGETRPGECWWYDEFTYAPWDRKGHDVTIPCRVYTLTERQKQRIADIEAELRARIEEQDRHRVRAARCAP